MARSRRRNTARLALGGAVALVAVVGTGCSAIFGEDEGAAVSRAGIASDIEPAGDTVEVTRVSPPSADRLSLVVVVENGGVETIDTGAVVGVVFDGAGTRITQGSGFIAAPRHIEPGALGFARVTFQAALPDPFTVEWQVADADGEADRFDLPLSRFELDGEQVRADVENNRDGTVIVVEVRMVCLDQGGNAIDLLVLPGPTSRVPSDGQVTVEGAALPGCAGAIGGAVGRTP